MDNPEQELLAALWSRELPEAGQLPALELTGSAPLLPSPFQVDVLAAASIALATASAASLWQARTGKARGITLDRRHAAAAFRSERYAKALERPEIAAWDAIAGDYETRDGFIRLHTNYQNHRAAVLRVLGVKEEREAVAQAVRDFDAETLEALVVEAGGCAAMLRERSAWQVHAQGAVLASEPLFAWSSHEAVRPNLRADASAPLAGVRVLDLTRVIAGPVATRFLSAYGADVLRIDPPGFEEVSALLPDTTAGKRRAALDLKSARDLERFKRLLSQAHVLIVGYRGDALARLGLDAGLRKQLNPALVTVSLNAYGRRGPWSTRRGFDSLVQMSSGIAAAGREWKRCREPCPLPAQALDHATGYLAAAAACHGLVRALKHAQGSEVHLSLAGSAELLFQLGVDHAREGRELSQDEITPYLETGSSAWGPVRRLTCPGAIEGLAPRWSLPAGALGSDVAEFPA